MKRKRSTVWPDILDTINLPNTEKERYRRLEPNAALLAAAFNGHIDIVKQLLDLGCCDKDAKNNHGYTALMLASTSGHLAIVQALLTAGADKETKNNDGSNALMLASGYGHLPIVQALLMARADKTAKDIKGRTALMCASSHGHLPIVQALLATGVDKEAKDNNGCTTLMYASGHGHLPIVQALLTAGVDKDAKDFKGRTALMCASNHGHLPVVQALLTAGANKDATSNHGFTALIVAAFAKHLPVVQKLLSNSVNIDAKTSHGYTALFFAIEKCHLDMIKELLRYNANYSEALLHAVNSKKLEVIEYFVLNVRNTQDSVTAALNRSLTKYNIMDDTTSKMVRLLLNNFLLFEVSNLHFKSKFFAFKVVDIIKDNTSLLDVTFEQNTGAWCRKHEKQITKQCQINYTNAKKFLLLTVTNLNKGERVFTHRSKEEYIKLEKIKAAIIRAEDKYGNNESKKEIQKAFNVLEEKFDLINGICSNREKSHLGELLANSFAARKIHDFLGSYDCSPKDTFLPSTTTNNETMSKIVNELCNKLRVKDVIVTSNEKDLHSIIDTLTRLTEGYIKSIFGLAKREIITDQCMQQILPEIVAVLTSSEYLSLINLFIKDLPLAKRRIDTIQNNQRISGLFEHSAAKFVIISKLKNLLKTARIAFPTKPLALVDYAAETIVPLTHAPAAYLASGGGAAISADERLSIEREKRTAASHLGSGGMQVQKR